MSNLETVRPARHITAFPPITAPESPSLRNFIGIVWSRARGAAIVGVLVFLTGMGGVSLIPRTYYAEGSVLIQPRRPNLAQPAPSRETALPPDTSAIDTEVEVLRSRGLFEDTVAKLKLYDDPEFSPNVKTRWTANISKLLAPASADQAADASADRTSKIIDAVQRHSNIRRVGLTYVVRIGFSSISPAKAERIANALMDTYMT